MRAVQVKLWLFIVLVVMTSWVPSSARGVAETGQGPALTSIGPLTFGADGTLFAADNQAAAVFALDLGRAGQRRGTWHERHSTTSTRRLRRCSVPARGEISITDLVVHPRSHNTFVSVMRGQGSRRRAGAAARRRRGNDRHGLAAVDEVLEARAAECADRQSQRSPQRAQQCDHRHGVQRRQAVDRGALERGIQLEAALGAVSVQRDRRGTSVEIFHGNHGRSRRGRRSTRSCRTR